MYNFSLPSALMELLQTQVQHGPFPSNILDGMSSPSGADLSSVQQLDTFLEKFFTFEMPANFFIQMAVAGAWILMLIVIGTIVIIHRIRKKAFWLFKFQRRSEGIYVVPNALNCFLLLEGCFGIIWVAFVIVQYRAYWIKDPSMQYHIAVLNLIIWWPLWIGAFLAGWGSFYTAPGVLDKGPLNSSKVGKFAPRPTIINIFCLGTPFVLILSLLAPIILAQIHFNSAFKAFQSLHKDLFASISNSNSNNQVLSASLAQTFLQRASQVWEMQTISAWYLSIGFAVWSIWAGIFMLFYLPAGGYLCFMVWRQLQAQKVVLIELEIKKQELEEMERKRKERSVEEQTSDALLFQPLTTSQQDVQRDHQNNSGVGAGAGRRQGGNGASTLNESPRLDIEAVEEREDREIFFPPLRPEVRRAAIKRISIGGTPKSRYNYLRRCFINLTILFVGIVFGAALYLGVSASLARYLYHSYLHDPQDCTNIIYINCVITAWGAVLFGTLTIFAIFARFVDPANFNSHEESEVKRTNSSPRFLPFRIIPFLNRNTSDNTLADNGQGQEKSRSMPAVPESVGGTMDDQLRSNMSYSSRIASRSRGGVMRFNILNRSGRLIMRPAADTSFTHQESAASFGMVEQLRSIDSRGLPASVPQDMTISEEESQLQSRPSYRQGSLVYQPTPYGDMPCPAPLPKPLAPERSPPLSPVRLDVSRSSSSQRRPSEWELKQAQILGPPRRYSEQGRYPPAVKSQSAASRLDRSPSSQSARLRSTPPSPFVALPELSPPPTGPIPPTPSTASTSNFPATPTFHNWQFPGYMSRSQHILDPLSHAKHNYNSTTYPPKAVVHVRAPVQRYSPGVFF